MISIIIPVYNVNQFLPQCLDSIIHQTYRDFEVILIDDGSTDQSGEICDVYAKRDLRIRVVHQSNSGVSIARNNGIILAQGEWITFIDSDDFVSPDYLKRFCVDKSDSDLIIQGMKFFDHQTNDCFRTISFNNVALNERNIKSITEDYELLHLGYPYGKAIRKKLILDNNLLFNENIAFHEDHIFVFQIFNFAKTISLSEGAGYIYRCRHNIGGSLSSKRHKWYQLNDASNGMLKALEKISDRFLKSDSEYSKKIYSCCYEPKMQAVFEIFRTIKNCHDRKSAYHTVINRSVLFKLYTPDYFHGKISRFIMVVAPYPLIDLYVRLYIRFQGKL